MKQFLTRNGLAALIFIICTAIVISHMITGVAEQLFPLKYFYFGAYITGAIMGVVSSYTFKKNHIAYMVENQKLKFNLRESESKYSAMTKVLRGKIDFYFDKCQKYESDIKELSDVKNENAFLKSVIEDLRLDKEALEYKVEEYNTKAVEAAV